MFKSRAPGVIAFALTCAAALAISGHSLDKDDEVYNQIVRIKGTVQILNHPQLGTTKGSGQYIVFRREDCKSCLIATWTGSDGTYEVNVGRGRYRVIMRDVRGGGEPSYDMLAGDQPRYVDAYSLLPEGNRFDIRVTVPSK